MGTRLLGYILIGVGVVLAGAAIYMGTHKNIPLIYSPTQMMGSLWSDYKLGYLEDNRTIDRQRENITTSEGQSYTMLRAVWMGDKPTFDAQWQWTKDNLNRSEDRLSSWLFGKDANGKYGILTAKGGANSASDAEQDLALALIFAFARWQNPTDLGDARVILDDVWDKEVFLVNGRPYLAANNLEKFSSEKSAIVNPSYLSPYAYRIFAMIDPKHDWKGLVDTSYQVLNESLSQDGLPPDWVRVDKSTGKVLPAGGTLPTDFSYDALRTPWRLALDWQWYGDERAKNILLKMHGLSQQWMANKKIVPTAQDGSPAGAESPALYGGTIGYFMVADPAAAKELYLNKLQFLYDPNVNRFKDRLSYYDDNWTFFGIGLYNNLLPNLALSIPQAAYSTP